MEFSDHLEASGNWVFRWRSYLPRVLIGILLAWKTRLLLFTGR